MKRWTKLLVIAAISVVLSSCGKESVSNVQEPTTTQNTEPVQQSDAPDVSSQGAIDNIPANTSEETVDLTVLSSTMVYSEVYNMMMTPENYVGKTIKMKGQFTFYQATDENGDPIPDQIYFACIIADATACCSQGLEFVLAGEHSYPADYPELGTEITVVGTFQTYEENGYMYCHLVDAEMAE